MSARRSLFAPRIVIAEHLGRLFAYMSTGTTPTNHQGLASRMLGALSNAVADWGAAALGTVEAIGSMSAFAWSTLVWLFTRLPRRETLMPNFYQVGVLSLPVVALTGTFIGMVLAVQSYFQFRQLGLETRLGAVINMSLVRELGPVLAATMLAGRVGSAMAAELGTMRVTEQIDALASMGSNPDPLPGRAAFSGLPVFDSRVDRDGRLHGHDWRLVFQRRHPGNRHAPLYP